MRKGITIALAWCGIVLLAAFLRLDDLGKRPMHNDESTGAKILSLRLESGDYLFDPTHFHGPLFSQTTVPIAWIAGQHSGQELSKKTVRWQPVIAGMLLVMVPLLWTRRIGPWGALATGLLIACSPILVYYNRMYIHESMLALLTMLGLLTLLRWMEQPTQGRAMLTGTMVGLMAATKETFVISLLAWGIAMIFYWTIYRQAFLQHPLKKRLGSLGTGILAGLTVMVLIYTDGARHWQGALDAFRTVVVYETGAGHDKPFWYYGWLLLWPKPAAGATWWQGLPLLLGLFALMASRGRYSMEKQPLPAGILFIALATVAHFAIYSCIAYKTPWLMLVPWSHALLLAGMAVPVAARFRRGTLVMVIFVVLLAAIQLPQTRLATTRLAADARNPYAYSPTLRDAEGIGPWLARMDSMESPSGIGTVAVIGTDYWPLPWYLRDLHSVGYWPVLQAGQLDSKVVLALPDQAARCQELLQESHVAVPRGLRENVPVLVFVRKDVWNRWLTPGAP